MPVAIDPKGGTEWRPIDTTPPTNVGDLNSQEKLLPVRVQKTVEGMKRIKSSLSEEDYELMIGINANNLGIDPEDFRKLIENQTEPEEKEE